MLKDTFDHTFDLDFSRAKVGDLRKIAADLGMSENNVSKAQLTKTLHHHHITVDHAKHIKTLAGTYNKI